MTLLTRLRKKYNLKDKPESDGIIEHTAGYFEMEYLKFGSKLFMCFLAPDLEKARIKAKSVLRTHNGEKVLNIRKLDAKNLGKSLTWNRDGTAYSRYQSKRNNVVVYKKDKK